MSNKASEERTGWRSVGFGLTSCCLASLIGVSTAKAEKPITVAFAMKTHQEKKWTFNEQSIRDEAAKLGVNVIFQWANNDPSLQASQFENLITQQPDVIVIGAVDSSAAGRLVDEAHEAKIPVIGYDVGVSTAKLNFKVMRDDPQTGRLQAESALKFAPHGTYAVIKGEASNNIAHAIEAGYNKVLKEDEKIKVVYNQYTPNWDPQKALAAAENVLSAQNDKVDAFLTMNDGMASGVAKALEERNLGGKVFLSGLDADTTNLQLIARGIQTMTVWQDLGDENRAVLRAAIALAEGQSPATDKTVMVDDGAGKYPAEQIGVIAVTKDNVCKFVTEIAPKGWVTVEEVFPGNPHACN
jgi:D-xylose transport system substrate-binding protein